MRSEELHSIIKLAITMATISVFCIILIYLASIARKMYAREAWVLQLGENIRMEAEDYLFQHGQVVRGNDIVEFILKHDNRYDYTIKVGSRTYLITNDQYIYYLQNPGIVEDATIIWSQDYLVNRVLKDEIYRDFSVTIDNTGIRKLYQFVVD